MTLQRDRRPRLLAGAVSGSRRAPTTLLAAPALAIDWNETVLRMAEAEDGLLTLKGVRTAAMMHIAMHDALSNIDGRYATYAYDHPARRADPRGRSRPQAAFAVTAALYPGSARTLEALRARWLDAVPEGRAKQAGSKLGAAAAAAILHVREGDGWDTEAEYHWHPMGPGVYAEFHEHSMTPEGFVFGAGWAKAKGFALDQFRPVPRAAAAGHRQPRVRARLQRGEGGRAASRA